jgi:hypothetical protein
MGGQTMTSLLTSLLLFISTVLLVQFEFSWYWFVILVVGVAGVSLTDSVRSANKDDLLETRISEIQNAILDVTKSTTEHTFQMENRLTDIKESLYYSRPTHNVNSKLEKELSSISHDIKSLENTLYNGIDNANSSLYSIQIALSDLIPEKSPFDDRP